MKRFITFTLLLSSAACLYAQQGSLDKSYGKGGIALTKVAGLGGSTDASAIQSDDKVIIGAYYVDGSEPTNNYSTHFLILQRYNKDGDIDRNFGNDGNASRLIDSPYTDNGEPGWKAIVVQPDGYILAATSLYEKDTSIELPFDERGYATLARFKPDGSPDSSFGINGMVITDVNGQNADIKAMALQKDGKIVLTGQISKDEYSIGSILLMRYNPDGTLDKTFGGTGYLAGSTAGYANLSILIQPDGKLLSGGYNLTSYLFSLFRYLPDGTPDASFGNNGKALTSFPETIYTQVNSLALLEDGRILAGGTAAADELYTDDMTVLRYLPDGTLDKTFGKNGKAFVSFGSNDTTSTVNRLFVQPDGKILLAGGTLGGFLTGADNVLDFVLARLLPDGLVDSSFGANGKTITDLNGGSDDVASGAVMQSDGNVVVTGTALSYQSSSSYQYYYALARYNTGSKEQRPIVIKLKRFLQNHGIEWKGLEGASYYSIERNSGGGAAFREVGRVPGSAGRQSYNYVLPSDPEAGSSATDSYRVKEKNIDGRTAYSNVVTVSSLPVLSVRPNPTADRVVLSNLDETADSRLTITDASGTVWLTAASAKQPTATLDVSRLRAGTYTLTVSSRSGQPNSVRFVKQ